MKKIFASLLAALLLAGALSGCAQTAPAATEEVSAPAVAETPAVQPEAEPAEKTTVRLAGLKGATSIGMVKLLSDAEAGLSANDYDFTMAGSADELTPLFIKGELDVMAVPLNLASVLYNKTAGGTQLLAVNTLGVLYLVEKGGEQLQSWEDLRGQTLYATGKGSTPEYALRYLLQSNGLNPDTDVTIEWKSEPTEVVALLSQQEHAVAMLPQPYVSVAQSQVAGLRVAMDLTEQWDALEVGSRLLTAGLIVRTEFAQEHPEAVAALLDEYAASTQYVNENVADAAKLVEQYDILKAAVAEKAIPYCNIVCITGADMKAIVPGYLQVLFDQAPEALGGAMPQDAFYYGG